MLVDISKITLDNIDVYSKLGKIRKGQHLSIEEKEFLKQFEKPKYKTIYKTISRVKLSEKEKKQRLKEYNHNYYMTVTKEKRRLKRLLGVNR